MKQFLITLRNTFAFNLWDVFGLGVAYYVIKQKQGDINELFAALLEWPLYLLMLIITALVCIGDWLLIKRASKGSFKGELVLFFKSVVRVIAVYLLTICAYFFWLVVFS